MKTLILFVILFMLTSLSCLAQTPVVDVTYNAQIAWDPTDTPAWQDISPFSFTYSDEPLGIKRNVAITGKSRYEFMGLEQIYWSDGSIQVLPAKKVTMVLDISAIPGSSWYQKYIVRVRPDIIYEGKHYYYPWSPASDVIVLLNLSFVLKAAVLVGNELEIK